MGYETITIGGKPRLARVYRFDKFIPCDLVTSKAYVVVATPQGDVKLLKANCSRINKHVAWYHGMTEVRPTMLVFPMHKPAKKFISRFNRLNLPL